MGIVYNGYGSLEECDDGAQYPRMVQFRLGLNTVRATAELIDPFYYHVTKLNIHRSPWQRFVSKRLLPSLPAVCQRLITRWWPAYALPDCIVMKKLQKPDHRHAFANEQKNYRRLEAFQGRIIPHFYGEVNCEGARALLISYVPGVTAREQPKPRLTTEELVERIRVSAEELATSGIVYADGKLNNIILTDDGRVVFIDLEMAEEESDPALFVKYLLLEFKNAYERYLKTADKEDSW